MPPSSSSEAERPVLEARRAVFSKLGDSFSLPNRSPEELRRTFETLTSDSHISLSTINFDRIPMEGFVQEQRWQDVIWVLTKILQLTWFSVFGDHVNVPDVYNHELGDMASGLARAQIMIKQLTVGAQIYLQLFLRRKRSWQR